MFVFYLSCLFVARSLRKSIAAVLVYTALFCFLYIYISNIQTNRTQLSTLSETIPVSAHISNLCGSKSSGLFIKNSLLYAIETSRYVDSLMYSVDLHAGLAADINDDQSGATIYVSAANSLAIHPEIEATHIEEDFFQSQNAQCLVNQDFLERVLLKTGDTINLSIYYLTFSQNYGDILIPEYLAQCTLAIVGTYTLYEQANPTDAPDIILPIGWIKNEFITNDVEPYASTIFFSLNNPLQLNDFKTAMKELMLLQVNPLAEESLTGNALVVDDETFVRSATAYKSNLQIQYILLPFVFLSLLIIGYVASHLLLNTQKKDYAIMRSMGMPPKKCFAVFLGESAIIILSGGLLGILLAFALVGLDMLLGVLSLITILLVCMGGAFTSVKAYSRASVLSSLIICE